MKRVLGSSRLPLEGVVTALLSIVDTRTIQAAHRKFADTMKKSLPQHPQAEYESQYTKYCCVLINQELKKFRDKVYTVTQVGPL